MVIDGLDSRLEGRKRISGLKSIKVEITQSEQETNKPRKKKNGGLRDFGYFIIRSNICVESRKKEEKEQG